MDSILTTLVQLIGIIVFGVGISALLMVLLVNYMLNKAQKSKRYGLDSDDFFYKKA